MDQNFDYNATPENDSFGFDSVPPTPSTAHKGFAVASMVLGIASVASCLCCCCCGFVFIPFLCAVLAIVFAVIARNKASDRKMPGMATAGLILGIVGLILSVILFAFSLILPALVDESFLVEYEEILRAELGDELFEEYFGEFMPAAPLE